ncbi:MAG TPA: hypothetical protein VHS99_18725, partial [Chloroflexota bacterium]|nr:hypothetical protein [Chloroflexota bacterium]
MRPQAQRAQAVGDERAPGLVGQVLPPVLAQEHPRQIAVQPLLVHFRLQAAPADHLTPGPQHGGVQAEAVALLIGEVGTQALLRLLQGARRAGDGAHQLRVAIEPVEGMENSRDQPPQAQAFGLQHLLGHHLPL